MESKSISKSNTIYYRGNDRPGPGPVRLEPQPGGAARAQPRPAAALPRLFRAAGPRRARARVRPLRTPRVWGLCQADQGEAVLSST